MTGVGTEDLAWAADRLFGSEPVPPPCVPVAAPEETCPAVDLDDAPGLEAEANPNAGARKVAGWLVIAFVLAGVVIVVVLLGVGGERPAPRQQGPAPVVLAAPSTTAAPASDRDRAIAYAASANCPPGSTSPQSLTDSTGDGVWTCVRGERGGRVDGQVLHVDFGGSHVITAVSVTPGWIARTPGREDEWSRHRVVTRLQYVFDDPGRTVFTQDTGNAHGPVINALPKPVVASAVTVVVLQTSRPPATPAPAEDPATPSPGPGDSLLGSPDSSDGVGLVGPAASEDSGETPVDATFAISALSFLGHEPT